MERTHLDYVSEMFDCISQNNSRNVKEELLKRLKEDPTAEGYAKELLSIALDWYRHFGVTKLPPATSNPLAAEPEMFFTMVKNIEKGIRYTPEMIANTCGHYRPGTEEWLRRCILKNLKMGASSTTINKVWPGLIRTFECQLAMDLSDSEEITEWPVLVEPKVDGVRCVAIFKDGKIQFISRGGQELFNLSAVQDELIATLSKFDITRVVLDGELFVDSLPRTMSVVRSSVNAPEPDLVSRIRFYIFDVLYLSEWESGKPTTVQWDRTGSLYKVFQASGIKSDARAVRITFGGEDEATLCYNAKQLETIYEKALEDGWEGVMIKELSAAYSFKRSQCWRKYKPHQVNHFEIVGWYEGEGRHEGRLGGFEVRVSEGKICRVGGGFKDEEREKFWVNKDILLGRVVRVKYKESSADGLLREPVYLGFI